MVPSGPRHLPGNLGVLQKVDEVSLILFTGNRHRK